MPFFTWLHGSGLDERASYFTEPGGNSHVDTILGLIIPNEQFLSNANVPGGDKIETLVDLSKSEILFAGVSCTLYEVHPIVVALFRAACIDKVRQ